MTRPPENTVCVGAIAGAHGVHGDARIKSFCADPEAIAAYGGLLTEDGRTFSLRITRPIKNGYAARLSGIANREAAEALKGTRLYAPRDRLPALPDDEYYHADLIGLSVFDTGGVPVGRVRAVHDFGAGDVLEITLHGGNELLLPFTQAVVPTVDLTSQRMIADLAEAGEEVAADDRVPHG